MKYDEEPGSRSVFGFFLLGFVFLVVFVAIIPSQLILLFLELGDPVDEPAQSVVLFEVRVFRPQGTEVPGNELVGHLDLNELGFLIPIPQVLDAL